MGIIKNAIRYLLYRSFIASMLYGIVYHRWLSRYNKKEGFLSGSSLKNYLSEDKIFQYHGKETVKFYEPFHSTNYQLPNQISFYINQEFEVSAGEVYHFEQAFLMGENAVGLTLEGQIILDTAMDLPNVLHKCSPRLLMNYDSKKTSYELEWCLSAVHIFCNAHYVNYFHWVCDSLLLIEGLRAFEKKTNQKIKLIVNDHLTSFQTDLLTYLDFKAEDLITWKEEDKVLVKNLLVVKSRRTGTNMDEIVSPQGVRWLRESLVRSLKNRKPLYGKRIFLSRQETTCRRIVNFDQIEPILKRYEFEIVNPDKLSIADQVNLFTNMEILCAPHGAGLTNIIFSEHLKILEFIGNVDVPDDFQWYCAYYSMSQAIGHQYSFLIGETIPLLKAGKTKQIYDLKMNVKQVDQILEAIINEA
ncbi:MAG: hypothetical protein ACI9GZ_001472 [Bacteroidia bacterium]|jgi:hypothetical protein